MSNVKLFRSLPKVGLVLALAPLTFLGGCSSIEPWVKPYERQNLADPIMKMGRHPIANMHVAHVLEGRESARGAEGTGGGGCGCN